MMAITSAELHQTDFPMIDQMYCFITSVRAAKEIIKKELFKRE